MSDQPAEVPSDVGTDGRPEVQGPPLPPSDVPDYVRDPHSRARKAGWWRKP